MDDLDSLLQDLERATSNLKNNPGNLGGWKLNKPNDSTISPAPTYTKSQVAKHYSPQYYVPDEPLYQNEVLKRSQSNTSYEHDYAAVNGRNSESATPKTPSTPTMHEGRQHPMATRHSTEIAELTKSTDIISEKLSMLDNLLEDLNAARSSYEQNRKPTQYSPVSPSHYSYATLPTNRQQPVSSQALATNTNSLNRLRLHDSLDDNQPPPVNGGQNHLVNGDSSQRRPFRERNDSDQVNMLIQDLEYNLHNNHSNASINSKPAKSVTIANGGMPTASVQSPTHSAQIQPVSEYNRQLVNIQPQHVQMNNSPVIQVPLPSGATSNATRELDDLMASLSDFKMNQMKGPNNAAPKSNYVSIGRVQVPSKNAQHQQAAKYIPSVDDLDSMIGNLELDMNKHGVSTITKGICNACGKTIVGQVVAALGKTWHPEHFTCAQCQMELGDKNFFEREGLAYCEEDYHKLYSPRCNHCNKPILDRCITALDKTWHPEHFFCAHCGKNFGDDGYHEKAGNAYCLEDYFKLFAPKCAGCANPITDNYITALGAQWHSDCFVCRDCKSPFVEGQGFFDFEGNPYCETHYHDKRGTLCASCHKPITGRCITAMFQKYHPEHFTCSFCLKQLNKGTFKKHNEKPYCHSCFDKLFA